MKLPYIKIYTADLLAAGRNLTDQQVGRAILGICELAFENDTAYLPDSRHEEVLFDMLTQWKEEATASYQQNKKKIKKARSVRWQKQENSVGQSQKKKDLQTAAQHTETKTDTETDTETETQTENIKTPTAQTCGAQGGEDFPVQGEEPGRAGHHLLAPSCPDSQKVPSKTLLQLFSNQVLAYFEPNVITDEQKRIWFKRNCRCLSDILNFCGRNIPLALQTIQVCATKLAKLGLGGGYEAVCRNLPECYAQAQKDHEAAHASR